MPAASSAVNRFRAGEDLLYELIRSEIGDPTNKRIVHLQCHIGIETLCLARRGAIVTGLDFSLPAIAGAQALAAETGVPATFVCASLYDAPAVLKEKFDIVFVSWGSLNWLPDIRRWAEVIGALLAPGGYLYLIEQHPFVTALKEIDGRLVVNYAWRTSPDHPVVTDTPTAYNEDASELTNRRMHEWDHPLSDIIGSLLGVGLRLDFLHEHEVLPWQRLPMMVLGNDRLFRLPESAVPGPLTFSLKASKPSG